MSADFPRVWQPMGWRNWNFYQGEITQEIMEANMHAMVDKTRTPLGHSEVCVCVCARARARASARVFCGGVWGGGPFVCKQLCSSM